MAKTLRIRERAGWATKPLADTPTNAVTAQEVDDNFLYFQDRVDSVYGSGSIIYASDYEHNLAAAWEAASDGDTIILENRTYNFIGTHVLDVTNLAGAIGNTKQNITLLGAGMPRVSSGRNMLYGGTVIQGVVLNLANGFKAFNLGIDCGSDVVAMNGGVYLEGFVPGTQLTYPIPSTQLENVMWDNICVLMKQPTIADETKKHAFLAENLRDAVGGFCRIYGGYHGFVWKSHGGTIGAVETYGPVGNSFIIKGDASDNAQDLNIGSIKMDSLTGESTSQAGAGKFNGSSIGGSGLGQVQRINIGQITAKNTYIVMQTQGEEGIVSNVHVGSIIGENVAALVDIDSTATRISIGHHFASNCSSAGIITNAGCLDVDIGDGMVVGSDGHGYILSGDVKHGRIRAKNCGGWGVNRGDARVNPDNVDGSGNSTGLISSLAGVSWESFNYANTPALDFTTAVYAGRVRFQGSLYTNSATTMGILSSGYRPLRRMSFPVTGDVAGVTKSATMIIETSGVVSLDVPSVLSGGTVYLGSIDYSLTMP